MTNIEKPKVSIIMPVFNAEKYLRRAIDSIIAQTLQDWELICVNDGSTDGSQQILEEYAAKDVRVKVRVKVNEGVALARQDGVNAASGEYSIHFDSDDWAEPTMLEEMYQKAKEEDADVVIADFYTDKSDGSQSLTKQQPTAFVGEEALKDLFRGVLMGSIWHKMIRTPFYKEGQLRFYKGLDYCEDHLACAQLFKQDGIRITYIPKAFYHYVVNTSSITHTCTRRNYDALVMFQAKLSELLPEPRYKDIIDNAGFGAFINGFISDVLTEKETKEALHRYKNNVRKTSPKWRLGFFFMSMGWYSIAHKLIHF